MSLTEEYEEPLPTIKRGPGRPPKVIAEHPVDEPAPSTEQITYLPGPEDPSSVKWGRHTFHANVPKEVSDAALIERAKTNRYFKVGAFNPATDGVPTIEEVPTPKTPEQYRAHAVAWFKTMHSVEQMDAKWAAEEGLRIACGVGTDDLDYLGGLYQPKRAELKKQDVPG